MTVVENNGHLSPVKNHSGATEIVGDLKEFICGWGAAFINITLTFPINKVMFRQMLHGVHSQIAVNDLKSEGIRYLYRGILPPLLQKTGSSALMFGMYDQCQQVMHKFQPRAPQPIVKGASAILAGTTEAVLTPLERIQTILQDKHYHNRFKNSFHAFTELKSYGLKEYYRGLTPILLRNGPSNVLFFGLRVEVKRFLPVTKTKVGEVVNDFISGAVVGGFISTVFYPVNVAKTKMQSKVGGEYSSIWRTLHEIYVERGRKWTRIFYGVHVNCTRALLSWGIINASYELLKKVLFKS
ncbi:hypothetical protein CHUAL_012650 [Chamberlinius hualienensis]